MARKRHLPAFVRYSISFVALLLCLHTPLFAGNPNSAYYCSDTDRLLWFIHASDTHIGTSGSTDSTNLQWLVSQAKNVINPSFIVVSGDLTDSTNGNIFGYPNGPYQAEWDQYKNILSNNGVDASFYYDIPGNHDAYNDQYFGYYLANSMQGRTTGKTQTSWTRTGTWGKYHFLGVNTADNTGNPFSLTWPYGDNAGLDSTELSFISNELITHGDAAVTMVFGHHPLVPTGNSTDTYLFYGKDDFVSLMDSHGASLYGYGHTHVSSETFFTQNMTDGIFYFNVSALGKDSPNQYTVTAIDCNGIASATQTVNTWPVVLITAPMDRRLGGAVNPYAYTVPKAPSNPIRALVFDPTTVTQVQFRVNGGAWQPMAVVSGNSRLWQGVWDASALSEGEYTLDVQAMTGSGTRTDTVTTYVKSQLLYADFSPGGLYQYNGSAWSQLTPYEATAMTAAGSLLYASFGNGVWQYNGSTWTQLTPYSPEAMVASGSLLYGKYDNGIWQYNGFAWTQLTPNSPEAMVAGGSLLYGDFANGIWQYNGSAWTQLTPYSPEAMVAGGSLLYGDFANGIWQYNGSAWTQLTPYSPSAMVAAGSFLYGNFANGIWQYNGFAWTQLTSYSPSAMVAAGSLLYGDFGSAGIWMYNGMTWNQIIPYDPAGMAGN